MEIRANAHARKSQENSGRFILENMLNSGYFITIIHKNCHTIFGHCIPEMGDKPSMRKAN
jgi:hypothetical protein